MAWNQPAGWGQRGSRRPWPPVGGWQNPGMQRCDTDPSRQVCCQKRAPPVTQGSTLDKGPTFSGHPLLSSSVKSEPGGSWGRAGRFPLRSRTRFCLLTLAECPWASHFMIKQCPLLLSHSGSCTTPGMWGLKKTGKIHAWDVDLLTHWHLGVALGTRAGGHHEVPKVLSNRKDSWAWVSS